MTVEEHRGLARACREHGYQRLAEYHEKRARELADKSK